MPHPPLRYDHQTQTISITEYDGLKAMAMICPRAKPYTALRKQKWLRKKTQEVVPINTTIKKHGTSYRLSESS